MHTTQTASEFHARSGKRASTIPSVKRLRRTPLSTIIKGTGDQWLSSMAFGSRLPSTNLVAMGSALRSCWTFWVGHQKVSLLYYSIVSRSSLISRRRLACTADTLQRSKRYCICCTCAHARLRLLFNREASALLCSSVLLHNRSCLHCLTTTGCK